MMKGILFATDLDNTLLFSHRHRQPGDRCVERLNGAEQGFFTQRTLDLLPQVVQSARRLALEREGGALGTVTCARPLTEDQLGRLKETLCRLHRLKKVELEMRVDPSLLGGLRLELQGVTYDKSVRGGLDALARTLGEGRAL